MSKSNHLDDRGHVRMVDVGSKPITTRLAVAEGHVELSQTAFDALFQHRLAKGEALAVARVAGIQAAKQTASWVPLCHSIPLDRVEVEIEPDPDRRWARVQATVTAQARTGVEMEGLAAVSATCLCLYDMAKGLDRGISIGGIRVVRKEGGQSGSWVRQED